MVEEIMAKLYKLVAESLRLHAQITRASASYKEHVVPPRWLNAHTIYSLGFALDLTLQKMLAIWVVRVAAMAVIVVDTTN